MWLVLSTDGGGLKVFSGCFYKAWLFSHDLGSSSLTPLAPITMHEMKIETTRLMDPTKYDPSMSPYHSGKAFDHASVTYLGSLISNVV